MRRISSCGREGCYKFFVICGVYNTLQNWYKERFLFKKVLGISFEEFGLMIPFERDIQVLIQEMIDEQMKENR